MLDDGVLVNSTSIGSGGGTRDTVTDCENVLIPGVLLGIAVHFNLTLRVAHAGVKEELVLSRRWVDVGTHEIFFYGFTGVYVLEHSNLGMGVLAHAYEFPTKENLNSTLVAFLKGDLISVVELVDLLVRGPVLDLRTSCSGANKLVATEDRFVVESVEISTLALVGDGGRVVDVVTSTLHPSVVEVALNAGFIIKLVDKDVI